MQKEYSVEVKWYGFPLHPETPLEGRSLEDLFRIDSERVSQMVGRLHEQANHLGLPFGKRTMTYNSRLAQELGVWAQNCGAGERYHQAAFTAYFAEGKNIADEKVLLEITEACGLDPHQARRIISERTMREAVDKEWQQSRELGITAVPTLVFGQSQLVGLQRYSSLQGLMMQHGVPRRS